MIWWQNTIQMSGWMVNGGVATKQRKWQQVVTYMTQWAMVSSFSFLLLFDHHFTSLNLRDVYGSP